MIVDDDHDADVMLDTLVKYDHSWSRDRRAAKISQVRLWDRMVHELMREEP